MTAGIAIEKWKLPIFKRHLDGARYSFTEHPGVTAETMFLKVQTSDLIALQTVIQAAQRECKTQ